MILLGASLNAAATPTVSLYKSKKNTHLILILRDLEGQPTAVYFGMKESLHPRNEARRLPPTRVPRGWSHVALSLDRHMFVPPPGSDELLTLVFEAEKQSIKYELNAGDWREVVDEKALRAQNDAELEAAFGLEPTCPADLRTELKAVSNI